MIISANIRADKHLDDPHARDDGHDSKVVGYVFGREVGDGNPSSSIDCASDKRNDGQACGAIRSTSITP